LSSAAATTIRKNGAGSRTTGTDDYQDKYHHRTKMSSSSKAIEIFNSRCDGGERNRRWRMLYAGYISALWFAVALLLFVWNLDRGLRRAPSTIKVRFGDDPARAGIFRSEIGNSLSPNALSRAAVIGGVAQPSSTVLGKLRAQTPNFGGLDLDPVPTNHFARTIILRDSKKYGQHRLRLLDQLDQTITSEDVAREETDRFEHYDEIDYSENKQNGCYRPRWSYSHRPNCNDFHEIDIVDRRSVEAKFLGTGYFRASWALSYGGRDVEDVVLKINRLYEYRNFKQYDYSQTQMEALCMLETHSSNRTMNIYGHCGTSVQVEPGYSIEDTLLDHRWIRQEHLDRYRQPDGDVRPFNDYTPEEKLEIALAMAEGLAELHGNRHGVLVSHDLGLDQYLVSKKDGLLKLNDFNKARALCWNPTSQTYGKIWSRQFYSFRAPEELEGGWIDDSSDTLTLGKLLFCLLTGLRPYYYMMSNDHANRAILHGELPWVDPRYRTRSLIEARLVDIMERTWQHEQRNRATVFDVVAHLRETARLAGIEARGRWR